MHCVMHWIRARCWKATGIETEMSLLEVCDLSIEFGKRRVVDRVSFTLDAGEKLALVGESGSGKNNLAAQTRAINQPHQRQGGDGFART